jgi:O-antigen biosynthesis protein
MSRYDSICNVCGGADFRLFASRSDQVPVVACERCGHMVVEQFRDDLQALYGDDYFAGSSDAGSGYEEYEYSAEFGSAWAAALVRLLLPHGSVVDIGCASGHALKLLGPAYQRFGIELNEHMAEKARGAGVQIIAHDLSDSSSLRQFAGRFDVALAIAVFEHVPDFKGAVEAALKLLRPDGLLLFEVPLIKGKDDIWFRSSLEHIHYPTEGSLEALFGDVLGLQLAGTAVEIQDYGYVYVGLTSKSADAAREAGKVFERVVSAAPETLSREEAHFRWLFDLIHAAKVTPEILRILPRLEPEHLNPLTLRRISELWSTHEQRLQVTQAYLRQVEEARDWHAAESKKRDKIIADIKGSKVLRFLSDSPKKAER